MNNPQNGQEQQDDDAQQQPQPQQQPQQQPQPQPQQQQQQQQQQQKKPDDKQRKDEGNRMSRVYNAQVHVVTAVKELVTGVNEWNAAKEAKKKNKTGPATVSQRRSRPTNRP